jgi:predicted P-loop ATPase
VSETPAWLKRYLERGFRVVFYPTKRKGPIDDDWHKNTYTAADYRDGQNVGIVVGTEIEPGKYLVDIDFDLDIAVRVAAKILPATGFGFGRDSFKISHAFYTTSKPPATRFFDGVDGKRIIELRALAKDGTPGLQTMVPPSIHPEGERVVLRQDGDIGHCPEIERLIILVAIGCILLQHFGHLQFTHDARMATAGFLLKCGLTVEEVTLIEVAVAELTGNNKHDAETSVQSTATRIKQGEPVTGQGALVKMIGGTGRKATALIKRWLGVKDFIVNKDGVISKDKEHNIRTAIENLGADIVFDDFSQKTKVKYNGFNGQLSDHIRSELWFAIDSTFGFRPTLEVFDMVMLNTAHHNKVHPVKEYLDKLVWDGVPRVNRWLIEYGGAADNEYVETVTGLLMIAAVRRIRQPGCKVDEILVLESPQGKGKSSALRALCPNEDWFSDDFPMGIDSKEVIERTGGKWIIECAELAGARKAQAEHMKTQISRQTDGPVRMAYGRYSVEQARQFVVVGTTNSKSYLKDDTGNRRFWPVMVGTFDLQKIIANRDQLWAEANVREAAGESIRLPFHLYEVAGKQQEHRRIEDPWESILESTFAADKKLRVLPEQVWEALTIQIERRDERAQERVVKTMQRLGFYRVTVRDDEGKACKGWGRDPIVGNRELEFDN